MSGDGVTAASLAHAKKLCSLTASSWRVSQREIAAVAGSLRVLKLHGCVGVDDVVLAPLAGSAITELLVSCAPALTDAGLAAALAGTRVRSLGVSSCRGISGACFAALAELKEAPARWRRWRAACAYSPFVARTSPTRPSPASSPTSKARRAEARRAEPRREECV